MLQSRDGFAKIIIKGHLLVSKLEQSLAGDVFAGETFTKKHPDGFVYKDYWIEGGGGMN